VDEAIGLYREALGLRPAPNRPISLHSLATVLQRRFTQTGQIEDVDEAIALHREVLGLRPAPHLDRSSSLNNLAIVLDTRFGYTGQIEDVDEAIALHREALELRPAPYPNRSISLNNLANVLQRRFGHTGRIEDIDEAIALHREALGLLPDFHLDRSMSLNNLANVLNTRFAHTGQIEDVDEVVAMYREALRLLPTPHPGRSTSLNNLAIVLQTRFDQTGHIEDVDEATALHQEALGLLPTLHPNRPTSLNNLAAVLNTRFGHTGRIEDVDEAIGLYREALRLLPAPHPDRSNSLHNLAEVFLMKYYNSQQSLDLQHALDAFQASVAYEYAPAFQRFRHAKRWICVADLSQYPLEAYQAAIALLPRIVTLDLDLPSRQALTSGIDGLARDAAASAIRSGEYGKAITFLEEGRSVFWSQALQLRAPLAELESKAPSLVKEFKNLSHSLEQGSQRETSWSLSSSSEKRLDTEREAAHHRSLHRNWLSVLESIRSLDGLHDFLLPTSFDKLQKAAARGTIVILNASDSGCAALIVTLSNVAHVPLPRCTFKNVGMLAKMIQTACGAKHGFVTKLQIQALSNMMRGLPESSREDRYSQPAPSVAANTDEVFQEVLAILWTSVVEPIFRSLNLKV
jgi:tetratricopeptide (TPR) repeat protein